MSNVTNKPQTVASEQVVQVAVPLFLPKCLDYKWQNKTQPKIGQFVQVEVGHKKIHGIVMALAKSSPFKNLKIAQPLLVPSLSLQTVQFYRWVTRYTLSVPGDAVRAGLLKTAVPQKPDLQKVLIPTGQAPKKATNKRTAVLCAAKTPYTTVAGLARAAQVSAGVVKSLLKEKSLKWHALVEEELSIKKITHVTLSKEQSIAANVAIKALKDKKFTPILLDGVTGSGKTEVYFAAIANLLKREKTAQVLVTVPEIALTPQWLKRFESYFGFAPTLWHSGVSQKLKQQNWWHIITGKTRVVIGARSALFLPYKNLRFLVVDEEHDSSYKQDDVFRYHGRDMAIALAHIWKSVVILASATPSLETWHNALKGKYKHVMLPSRFGGAIMPDIRMINMTAHKLKSGTFISEPLKLALQQTLKRKQQSLVYLNRRGTAPLLLCKGCGYRFDCPSCDASLVVHGKRMQCHHCGFEKEWPEHCPKCDGEEMLAFGPGTRRIMEEIQKLFPKARVAVADSDALKTPKQMAEFIEKIQNERLDIIVGTQMIAKGHHFPSLTTVGVIDADMGLAHGDLRAAERTFQLLTQVSGRAGRAQHKGQVFIQSYDVAHPLFKAIKTMNRDAFYTQELTSRKEWNDPPFGRQISLIVSGKDESQVIFSARALAKGFPKQKEVQLLGPAPAVMARLRDKYRYRLLLKSSKNKPLQGLVQKWLSEVPVPQNVKILVDVDPVSFV